MDLNPPRRRKIGFFGGKTKQEGDIGRYGSCLLKVKIGEDLHPSHEKHLREGVARIFNRSQRGKIGIGTTM